MEITLDKHENAYGIIKLDLVADDYMPEVKKKIKDYSRKAVIKGFRPGKVPAGLINKMYGKQVKFETINDTINSSISKYIEDENLPVVFSPLLKSEPIAEESLNEDNHHLEFELFISPELDVVLDDTIQATVYKAEVSDEEVENTLNNLKKNYPNTENVEEIGEGDFIKGVFKSGEFEKESVLPLNQVEESARGTFLGKKKDETITFDLRTAIPEDKQIKILFGLQNEEEAAELNGEFELAVSEISRESEAEFNEEFFKKILGEKEAEEIKDLDAFKAKIKSILNENNNPNADYYSEKNIKKVILEKYDFDVNKEFVEKIYKINSQGSELSQEELDKNLPIFVDAVKWRVIGDIIAKKNEIKVEMDEVKKEAGNIVKQQFMGYNIPLDDAMLDSFAENYLKMEDGKNMEQTYDKVFQKKLFENIKSNINLEEVTLDEKQLKEMIEEERKSMMPNEQPQAEVSEAQEVEAEETKSEE
ncbi:MAG: hypothetical protein CMO01_08730 [Thalassobius sp.]|nr:hypothetical protein [Thalassovita sp.]